MIVHCGKCQSTYRDDKRSTICPHDPLMSDEDMAQKDAGIALLGKRVVFNHMPDAKPMRVCSCSWNGMVALDGMAGEFAPHLFKVKAS